jgi:DNA-binding transcriptional LysR family regulator
LRVQRLFAYFCDSVPGRWRPPLRNDNRGGYFQASLDELRACRLTTGSRSPRPAIAAVASSEALQIVAAGLAITTLAPVALDVLPDGVRVVAVRGEPQETRRLVLARRPGPLDGPATRVADALVAAARA